MNLGFKKYVVVTASTSFQSNTSNSRSVTMTKERFHVLLNLSFGRSTHKLRRMSTDFSLFRTNINFQIFNFAKACMKIVMRSSSSHTGNDSSDYVFSL